MFAMNLLKRVLPFLLALIMGAMLVRLVAPNIFESRTLLIVKPPQSQVEISTSGEVFPSSEVTKKAVLLSRPEATYTDEARRNAVQGTIRLRAVLSSSGEVTNIQAISGLPSGLTEQAMAAARQIEFTPAMKDGRAVSQYVTIEYVFNLY